MEKYYPIKTNMQQHSQRKNPLNPPKNHEIQRKKYKNQPLLVQESEKNVQESGKNVQFVTIRNYGFDNKINKNIE